MLKFKQFLKEKKDPCWKGYKQVGMKKKSGKKVPNCVPVEESLSASIHHTRYKSYLKSYRDGHVSPTTRILFNLAGSDHPSGTPVSQLAKNLATVAAKDYHQTGMVPKEFVKAKTDKERLAAIKHHVSKIKSKIG